jgi:hypothetical protein
LNFIVVFNLWYAPKYCTLNTFNHMQVVRGRKTSRFYCSKNYRLNLINERSFCVFLISENVEITKLDKTWVRLHRRWSTGTYSESWVLHLFFPIYLLASAPHCHNLLKLLLLFILFFPSVLMKKPLLSCWSKNALNMYFSFCINFFSFRYYDEIIVTKANLATFSTSWSYLVFRS